MTTAGKYRRKPYVVDAIQWDGTNVEAVAAFTDGDFEPEDGSLHDRTTTGYLFTGESYDKRGEHLHTGDWVICLGHGMYRVVQAGFFSNAYEPVEGNAEAGGTE